MTFEIWLAFAAASAVLLAIPGPTVALVVGYALDRGRGSAWATVPGVTLGDFTAMTASLAGAGAVLAASATLFTALKLAGAAYLVWLGVRMWRTARAAGPAPAFATVSTRRRGGAAMFWNAFLVTALNPKGIVFFIAFVPQFVEPARPVLVQFAILEATFLGLAAANIVAWVCLASGLRGRLVGPAGLRIMNRIGGTFLVGAGVATALARRGS